MQEVELSRRHEVAETERSRRWRQLRSIRYVAAPSIFPCRTVISEIIVSSRDT